MVSVSVRYLFYQPMDKKIKTWPLRFLAKENPNMERALFDWPIVLQYDVKPKYQLISRKFSGVTFVHPQRSLVRAFSFQGHTKIALSLLIVLAPIGTRWEDKQTAKINPDIFVYININCHYPFILQKNSCNIFFKNSLKYSSLHDPFAHTHPPTHSYPCN